MAHGVELLSKPHRGWLAASADYQIDLPKIRADLLIFNLLRLHRAILRALALLGGGTLMLYIVEIRLSAADFAGEIADLA